MAQRQCIRSLTSSAATCWRTAAARDEASRVHNQIHQHKRHLNTTSRQTITIPTTRRLLQRQSIPSRPFSTTPSPQHNDLIPPKPGQERHITFIDKELNSHTFTVGDGDNLLDIAQANDLEMEGACGGSCACSTCHVIVESEAMFDKMEEPSDDENDMLDLAFGLTETSRLGCQVLMRKELDGVVVKLPSMTRNMQASDFAEKEKKA
ncbi:mitochondrial matrix iron-sulfur protein [Elasticomyces elasticus]|nr:mitochondrial matrix iron-sulfur protein [Elasticomyces elasticus]KAK4967166.1 mitochondrial matrix iron-sulfur protein [Elasticomyces elasticus]